MSFRYYLYISDADGGVLSQIHPSFARVPEFELSVGVKVAGASRRHIDPSADRVARLERVARHLRDHAEVDTIETWRGVPAT